MSGQQHPSIPQCHDSVSVAVGLVVLFDGDGPCQAKVSQLELSVELEMAVKDGGAGAEMNHVELAGGEKDGGQAGVDTVDHQAHLDTRHKW